MLLLIILIILLGNDNNNRTINLIMLLLINLIMLLGNNNNNRTINLIMLLSKQYVAAYLIDSSKILIVQSCSESTYPNPQTLCVRVHACARVHVRAYMRMHTCACAHARPHTFVHACPCVRVHHGHKSTRARVCACERAHAYVRGCMNACACIFPRCIFRRLYFPSEKKTPERDKAAAPLGIGSEAFSAALRNEILGSPIYLTVYGFDIHYRAHLSK